MSQTIFRDAKISSLNPFEFTKACLDVCLNPEFKDGVSVEGLPFEIVKAYEKLIALIKADPDKSYCIEVEKVDVPVNGTNMIHIDAVECGHS